MNKTLGYRYFSKRTGLNMSREIKRLNTHKY